MLVAGDLFVTYGNLGQYCADNLRVDIGQLPPALQETTACVPSSEIESDPEISLAPHGIAGAESLAGVASALKRNLACERPFPFAVFSCVMEPFILR